MSIPFFNKDLDNYYMQEALKEAQSALLQDEVPIGAVIVGSDGTIIARAHNLVEKEQCQSRHAEVVAIENATQYKGDWRLAGCWIYVTLEPCAMCFGLIRLSRLSGIVYATHSPLFGNGVDKRNDSRVYKNDTLVITSGLMQQEAATILKQFFQKKRKKE